MEYRLKHNLSIISSYIEYILIKFNIDDLIDMEYEENVF